MDVVVPKTGLGDSIHGGRRDDSAKGAGDAVAGVIGDDQQHIGRALRWRDPRCPPGLGLQGAVLDHTTEGQRRSRQLVAAERGGGIGGSEPAGDRLSQQRRLARLPAHQQRHQGQGTEANDGARETACPQSAEQATDPGERRNETGISYG